MIISDKKKQNLVLILLVSLFLVVLVAAPASANLRGGDLLKKSIDAAQVSETAMDDMWTELFAPTALLYNQLIEVATIVLIIGFPFLMLAFARAAKDNDAAKTTEIIAWGLVVVILLYDKGAMLKTVTVGTRNLINDQAIALLDVQVDTLTIKDAMRDVILTEQLRGRVRNSYTECEAKEGSAQLECLAEAASYAESIVKEYEDRGILPVGIKRHIAAIRANGEVYKKALEAADDNVEERRAAQNQLRAEGNAVLFHTITGAGNQAILKSFQNWFTYGFEFALMLTGMLGPLAVAASLIPKSPRAVIAWMIGIVSIGVLKLSYNLVVGFAAIYASKASLVEAGSAGFLTMVSIGAPFISIAVAGGGGAAIFFALGKTSAMVATIIPVGSAAATSVASTAGSAALPPRRR